MTKPRTAVLLLAHGTPDSPGDVAAYLKNVTGGRALPDEVVSEIGRRYSLIGRSPLNDHTLQQAQALENLISLPVYVGMRNWHPFIKDTLHRMTAEGMTHAVAICLAPQDSRTSVGLYRRAALEAAGDAMKIAFVDSWHDHPLLVKAFAERLRSALPEPQGVPVLFTAHSVPCRTILAGPDGCGDPYGRQTRETAALVARELRLDPASWFFAFQSQGASGGPWIGPTVEESLSALRVAGHRRVVIQPVGFVCDHVEVLYDIDFAFRQFALGLGIELRRVLSLNDSPLFVSALADVVRKELARL